jgi:hypothetical protein
MRKISAPLKRIQMWLRRVLPHLIEKTYDQLYKRDLTKRRAKHAVQTWGRLVTVLILFGATVVFLLIYSGNIASFLLSLGRGAVDAMEGLAVSLGLNPNELVTIVSADLIVVIATGIMNLSLLRALKKEPEFPQADLRLYHDLKPLKESNATYFGLRVSNYRGKDAAPECRALAIFTDIEKRDIIDDSNQPTTRFISGNFTPTLRIPLGWRGSGDRHTLVSGDDGHDYPLEVFRLVPNVGSIMSHFEVLGDAGKDNVVCLNLKHYYGTIRILPSKGEFREFDFAITRDFRGNWVFDCADSPTK